MPTSNYLKPQFSFCFILQNISFSRSENTWSGLAWGSGAAASSGLRARWPRLGGTLAPRCGGLGHGQLKVIPLLPFRRLRSARSWRPSPHTHSSGFGEPRAFWSLRRIIGSYWILADRAFLCILTFPSYLPARPSASPSCISHPKSTSLPGSLSPVAISNAAVSIFRFIAAAAAFSSFRFGGWGRLFLTAALIHMLSCHIRRVTATCLFCMLLDLLWVGSCICVASWDVVGGYPCFQAGCLPRSPACSLLKKSAEKWEQWAWSGPLAVGQRGFWMQKTRIMLSWDPGSESALPGISRNTASLVRYMAS